VDHYAAIDVSLERSSVCIVDAAGAIVQEAKVASEPEAVIRLLRSTGFGFARVGLEAGPLSQWLHAGLVAAGFDAVLLETRRVKAALSAMTAKTDRNDARGIAQMLRMGWFRPVYAKTLAAQEVRALLSARKLLQSKLNDIELSLRGVLRGFGLKVGPTTPARFEARIRELVDGQATLEALSGPVLRARASLRSELAHLHKRLLAIARADDVCRLLTSMPGVGAIVALTFRAAVDDPTRFRRSRDVGAVFGLVPRRYQSGEVDRIGSISKAGDAGVRSALFEAALVLLTRVQRFSWLKAWAVRLAGRRGQKRAIVALARRMAVVMHRMWADGTPFRWTRDAAGAAPAV
jgi:transposase